MKRLTIETCPHCDAEIELTWDVDRHGYEIYCPFCGEKIMLCDECLNADDNECRNCDWCAENGCWRKSQNKKPNIDNVGFSYDSMQSLGGNMWHGECTIYTHDNDTDYFEDYEFSCSSDEHFVAIDMPDADDLFPYKQELEEILMQNLMTNFFKNERKS